MKCCICNSEVEDNVSKMCFKCISYKENLNTNLHSHSNEKEGPKVKHYNLHPSGIECIEIAQHHNFNVGNALKYMWRQGLKDGESSERDLQKAIDYLNFEIRRLRKEKKNE